ncbi:fungal-specific transcription factor domain-containing protein [Leptodontidium sp. 2 PMI_412]|nr:fungal-specific transcription factor domain-containing protein [Leptodontidium sp. 2 PMI_412]
MDQRRRSTFSCDNCRTRKVRCNKLEGGSCERCLKYSKICTSSQTKTSRPQYQTSKEQFELMTAALQHFLPGVSLKTDHLRRAVKELSAEKTERASYPPRKANEPLSPERANSAAVSQSDGEREQTARHLTEAEERANERGNIDGEFNQEEIYTGGQDAAPCPGARPSRQASLESRLDDAQTEFPQAMSMDARREMDQFQDSRCETQNISVDLLSTSPLSPPSSDSSCQSIIDDGVMFDDAMHISRFHYGSSYSAFFLKLNEGLASTPNKLFHRHRRTAFDSWGVDSPVPTIYPQDLPPRLELVEAAKKFFAEVNGIIYILQYERFYNNVGNIYARRHLVTNAGFAILYLILSLSQEHENYFAEGCRYCNLALEESSMETIQALMLLTICHSNRNQKNLAWIAIGSAIRIAQSLGLHIHESRWSDELPFQIESKKRLWWSLYNLETSLTCSSGLPPGIDESICQVSLPSETEFDLNPYSPSGYATASAQLGRLLGRTLRQVYLPKAGIKASNPPISSLLTSLQEWWAAVPAYLRLDCPTAPSNIRAICHLSLRYHHIISLVTRPYLLYSVTCSNPLDETSTQRVRMCEEANRESILAIKKLTTSNLISRINYFDGLYIVANCMILFLRCLRKPSAELAKLAEEMVPIMELVDHLSFAKYGLESMHHLIEDLKTFCTSGQSSYAEIPGFTSFGLDSHEAVQDLWDSMGFPWLMDGIDTGLLNGYSDGAIDGG